MENAGKREKRMKGSEEEMERQRRKVCERDIKRKNKRKRGMKRRKERGRLEERGDM